MRRSALLVVSCLAVTLAGAPAAHGGDWSAPFTVSGDRSMTVLSAAADPRGGMVVVWQHDTGRAQPPQDGGFGADESYIPARAFAPDGGAGVIQTLSITDDLTAGPSVAVDGKGGAVAAWTQAYDGRRYTILASPRAPAGRFGARQALGRTDRFLGGAPEVGMNARGDAVVLWARSDGVELEARRPGQHFGSGRGGEVVAAWADAGPIGAAAKWWISTAVRPVAASDLPAGPAAPGGRRRLRPVRAARRRGEGPEILWRIGDGPLLGARRAG